MPEIRSRFKKIPEFPFNRNLAAVKVEESFEKKLVEVVRNYVMFTMCLCHCTVTNMFENSQFDVSIILEKSPKC